MVEERSTSRSSWRVSVRSVVGESGRRSSGVRGCSLSSATIGSRASLLSRQPVAFKVYDMDRDGFISNGELFLVLKMMVGNNLKVRWCR